MTEIREILNKFKDMVVYGHMATWPHKIPIIVGELEQALDKAEEDIPNFKYKIVSSYAIDDSFLLEIERQGSAGYELVSVTTNHLDTNFYFKKAGE